MLLLHIIGPFVEPETGSIYIETYVSTNYSVLVCRKGTNPPNQLKRGANLIFF